MIYYAPPKSTVYAFSRATMLELFSRTSGTQFQVGQNQMDKRARGRHSQKRVG